MSDISKKIFSIEPEPDEEPIALVPEAPDAQADLGHDISETDQPPLLRAVVDIPAPLSRPIFELVDVIDDDDEDAIDHVVAPALNDSQDTEDLGDLENSDDTGEIFVSVRDETPKKQALSLSIAPEDGSDLDDSAALDGKTSEEIDLEPTVIVTDDPIVRPTADVPTSSFPPAPALAPPIMLSPAYIPPAAPAAARLGWVGPVLTILTGLAIGALIFAYIMAVETVSPIGLAALVMAVIVPMIAVIALWATLRALTATRVETIRLADVADRLTRADDAVTSDVARMSSAIKRELAQVDSRLAQSRDELDTLVALITRQSTEMNGMTQRLTDRSETIAKTVTDQRDAFAGLSGDFDTRMNALTGNIDTQRKALDVSSEAAAKRVGDASDALQHATQLTSDHGDAIATAASKANASITEAEARLSSLSEQIKTQVSEVDDFYDRRTQQLTDLSERLSNDKGLAETALYSQTEKLSAVDAQLVITESRLTALVDHAGQVQAQLSARLSDIDSTLSDADQRSRAFTADIADRVTDSVAQTRREISIMEGELRALQSRMDGAKSAELPLDAAEIRTASSDTAPSAKPVKAPMRVHLTPLDTDFPPLDQDDLSIPSDEFGDDPLDLIQVIEDSSDGLSASTLDGSDLVRRPGSNETPRQAFGRTKAEKSDKNWRWRDMLGSIDSSMDDAAAPSGATRAAPPLPKPTPAVDRPGPGVPLRAPNPRAPQPEGSDVVARLCEVKLAPSAIVDDGTIAEAASARQSGGEDAQSDAVFSRLNSPVIHLRGVLSADLEFRLRAEGFRRSYNSYLNDIADASRLRAELASANGRAYLLCATALTAS